MNRRQTLQERKEMAKEMGKTISRRESMVKILARYQKIPEVDRTEDEKIQIAIIKEELEKATS